MKLDTLRRKIDRLDKKMLETLARRFQLATQVRITKSQLGLPILDTKREKEILKKITVKSSGLCLNSKFIEELFTKIFEESKRIQEKDFNDLNQ